MLRWFKAPEELHRNQGQKVKAQEFTEVFPSTPRATDWWSGSIGSLQHNLLSSLYDTSKIVSNSWSCGHTSEKCKKVLGAHWQTLMFGRKMQTPVDFTLGTDLPGLTAGHLTMPGGGTWLCPAAPGTGGGKAKVGVLNLWSVLLLCFWRECVGLQPISEERPLKKGMNPLRPTQNVDSGFLNLL